MTYFLYILECSDNSFYTGITWSLEKRLREHNSGLSVSTKGRLPAELVYWETFSSKVEAAKREKEIKGWRREKKLALIKNLH